MSSELDRKLKRIESFKELKDGWYDGYGEAIQQSSIEFAKKMCKLLYLEGDTEFSISPLLEGGGIVFEWDNRFLEIYGY